MSNTAFDHPDVIIFPPLISLFTVVVACCLQWLVPLDVISNINQPLRIVAGAIIVIAGALTTISGRRALVKHGTNVNPGQPVTALVTTGIFRRTRNPLYLGVFTAQLGIALIFGLDWLPMLLVPSGLLMHFAVVRREELYLERKFGEEFRRYRSRVQRYILGL
jgi:protein-S-isoprenylcysteine O-methyltransferase Ste14